MVFLSFNYIVLYKTLSKVIEPSAIPHVNINIYFLQNQSIYITYDKRDIPEFIEKMRIYTKTHIFISLNSLFDITAVENNCLNTSQNSSSESYLIKSNQNYSPRKYIEKKKIDFLLMRLIFSLISCFYFNF